jgi:aspartyl-tRNA(Asn)/glutamyl-tRNA(Gln) amidotransferase subunit C
MSRVSEEEASRLAGLARIELAPGEAARLAGDLEKILEHVAAIEAADEAPRAPVTEGSFRDDEAGDRIGVDVARAAFPEAEQGFLKVPRVLPSHE